MIHSCFFFCLVKITHESLVCPEQFNFLLFFRKILQLPQMLWFSSISVYLNPFQQRLHDFEIHHFTLRTTEGLIYNYYRRFKRSLMLQKEKPCIKRKLLNRSIFFSYFAKISCSFIQSCPSESTEDSYMLPRRQNTVS